MFRTAPYRPHHPEKTPFYRCLDDYWQEFKESYSYFYEAEYGPWCPVVEKTVERFLQCGILRHGFARLRCSDSLRAGGQLRSRTLELRTRSRL